MQLQVHNVLYKDLIHLVIIQYWYKDLNQWSHLYKEHVHLYVYHNFMSYQIFRRLFISYSPPNDKKKIENDMILIIMSTRYFLIIWESNDPWVMLSLRPLWRMSSFSKKLIKEIITSYILVFLIIYLDKYRLCQTCFILSCIWASGFKINHIFILWTVILFLITSSYQYIWQHNYARMISFSQHVSIISMELVSLPGQQHIQHTLLE